MSELDEFYEEYNRPDEWSEARLDEKLKEQFDELIYVVGEMIEESKKPKSNPMNFRVHRIIQNNSSLKNEFIEKLHYELINNKLIEPYEINNFKILFNGAFSDSSIKCVNWKISKSLCVYLFEQLFKKDYILNGEIDKKLNKYFGIKGSAQLRLQYNNNKISKPRGYEMIDFIINKLPNK